MTISLWDFTWYTRTGDGQPFHRLDDAFGQAVDRGYDTVRVCAMPLLLFRSGLDTSALRFKGLGGSFGQRTRWYDVPPSPAVDGRAHLLSLFRAARRHGCRIIVSSWEYQQSPSFGADNSWHEALQAVPVDKRAETLADAHADLVDFVRAAGLDDVVAYVELHNEVQYSGVPDDRDLLEAGVKRFKERQPAVPVTVNYARVPVASMSKLPRNLDVAVFHPYVYGVLGQLYEEFALRDTSRPYPQERAFAELLRDDAPKLEDWRAPASWKTEATVVPHREIYTHDWCDPAKWDRWLYERYGEHRRAMRETLDTWLEVAADFAAGRGIPLVFGEGWVGYTPLHANFEEGPVGAEICAHAVHKARELGAWGTVVCSNAAPHHPMWGDVALQRRLNDDFRENR
ncbi:cellulase-like family protein [Actinoplanes solisilvae]|uniref:cellulase-like family protein n=1 Tax=Actinoplanes solisilvae TaxID=2486853 RepID=UPI001F0C32AA|nr:cellulase-like family protein [Actinoplanes solisilvae]